MWQGQKRPISLDFPDVNTLTIRDVLDYFERYQEYIQKGNGKEQKLSAQNTSLLAENKILKEENKFLQKKLDKATKKLKQITDVFGSIFNKSEEGSDSQGE